MQKELAKDIPQGKQRAAFLMDNCDKVEDKAIDEQLEQIRAICPEIAIIEV